MRNARINIKINYPCLRVEKFVLFKYWKRIMAITRYQVNELAHWLEQSFFQVTLVSRDEVKIQNEFHSSLIYIDVTQLHHYMVHTYSHQNHF